VLAPGWHHSDKLGRVAIWIPSLGVGIDPPCHCLGIAIVKGGLHHAAIHEQPFDGVAVPGAALVGELTVNAEFVLVDADHGSSLRLSGQGRNRCCEQPNQGGKATHIPPVSPQTLTRLLMCVYVGVWQHNAESLVANGEGYMA